MADVKKNCSKCGVKNVKVTKKGYDKDGRQRWVCSSCKKSFVVPGSKVVKKPVKATKKPVKSTKKPVKSTKKPVKINMAKPKPEPVIIKPEKTITTTIFVNSNQIKEIHKDIGSDEAFNMITSYFREITKTNVEVTKDNDGNKKIQFSIKTGTKG